jgi:DNA-directed RNA polymerase subunit RPC12/RpoP
MFRKLVGMTEVVAMLKKNCCPPAVFLLEFPCMSNASFWRLFISHFVAVYLDVDSFEEHSWFSNEDIVNIINTDKRSQHVPVKPFSCLRCGRSYKRKGSLNSHLINECGKEPQFHCPHCTYRCKVKSNLMRHFRTFHTIIQNSDGINTDIA